MATRPDFSKARRLFPHAPKTVYFNSASYGPFCRPVAAAIERNVAVRLAANRDDSHDAFAASDHLRTVYAGMIGAHKREVGIGLNTTFGLNIAAFGLSLKPGDEVLIPDIEFPAIAYTWRAAAEAAGFKVKFVKTVDRCFDLNRLEDAITTRTRVASLSWVQFFNGYKVDLSPLAKLCRDRDILLVVDGIQGMGVEPINVRQLGVDVFTSGCQKWMLSPQGGGFFYLSDRIRDKLKHPFMSWLGVDWKVQFTDLFRYDLPWFDSARRFEMGYYAVLNLLGMEAAAGVFTDLGIRNIQGHNYDLIDRLADFIKKHPFYRATSSLDRRHRSSIFTFTCRDYQKLHKKILKAGIVLVQREGSIRVSVHLFNNQRDIDRLKSVLEDFAREHRP
ncbi:MAG: aminotransferase class V-fold PLP-dependent enzyme [bacterium]